MAPCFGVRMSNTFKDVPYWVRLNRDGTATRHNHEMFGREVYHFRFIRDERGRQIYDEVPWGYTAREVTSGHLGWTYNRWATFQYPDELSRMRARYALIDRARIMMTRGEGDEMIVLGHRTVVRTERHLAYVVKDYCTAGEKIDKRENTWWGEMPCTPEIVGERPWYGYGTTSQRAEEHELYHTKKRTTGRKFEKRWVKEWNSGADLEDWDEDEHLTNDTHSYYYW